IAESTVSFAVAPGAWTALIYMPMLRIAAPGFRSPGTPVAVSGFVEADPATRLCKILYSEFIKPGLC
ncbi:hypothetical protein J7M07_07755, partial [bacterium]|nr:hypothetical protein [bacterium]